MGNLRLLTMMLCKEKDNSYLAGNNVMLSGTPPFSPTCFHLLQVSNPCFSCYCRPAQCSSLTFLLRAVESAVVLIDTVCNKATAISFNLWPGYYKCS